MIVHPTSLTPEGPAPIGPVVDVDGVAAPSVDAGARPRLARDRIEPRVTTERSGVHDCVEHRLALPITDLEP